MRLNAVFAAGVIALLPAFPAASPALTVQGAEIEFLWPGDEAVPGENLVTLEIKVEEGAERTETDIGPATVKRLTAGLPSGQPVFASEIIELDGLNATIIGTEIKKGIAAPTGDYYKPHFAAPWIKAPGHPHVLTYTVNAFSPPSREAVATTAPVVLYNDRLDVIIASPLQNFMDSMQAPLEGGWMFGFGGMIEEVPAGASHSILIVSGKGINRTFEKWGELIRKWYGHQRTDPYQDVAVSKLGYWTDNGAYYYYKTAPGMNYHQTLIALKEYSDELGVPYGYFQIDSWWYPKAKSGGLLSAFRGGALVWEPMPELFPRGLAAFQQELGLPLVAHNRWYDQQSPYCDRYECVYGLGDKAPALPIEPEFWDEIMDNALSYGVEVYEQDWLVTQMNSIPWLRQGMGRAENWFDAMVRAADERGLTMQLCMASPEFFLQQLKHQNVTHVRTSGDYQARLLKTYFWPRFHTTSMFAWAVGMYPFKDNFQTTPGQRLIRSEKWPFEEALISALSGGPVGPSDKIGHTDLDLLMKTCRQDGVLLKPDRPATPIDLMFLDNKKPWIVSTGSSHDIGESVYLAAFNIRPRETRDYSVSFSDLGLKGEYAIYDFRKKEVILGAEKIELGKMKKNDACYYVLMPVLDNGMAVIGEADKFATLSRKRFPEIRLDNSRLEMKVAGVPGERVNVSVYIPCAAGDYEGCDLPPGAEDFEAGVVTIKVTIPEDGQAYINIE